MEVLDQILGIFEADGDAQAAKFSAAAEMGVVLAPAKDLSQITRSR